MMVVMINATMTMTVCKTLVSLCKYNSKTREMQLRFEEISWRQKKSAMGHSASRVVVKADKIEKIEEEEERRVVVHCQGGKVINSKSALKMISSSLSDVFLTLTCNCEGGFELQRASSGEQGKNKVQNKVTSLNTIIFNNKVTNSSTKVTKALVDKVEIKSGAQQQALTATKQAWPQKE